VTLTNIPAFEGEIPRLQDQIKLTRDKIHKKGDVNMDKRLISLSADLKRFKLQNEVDPSNLIPLVEEMSKVMADLQAKIAEVMGQKEQAEEQVEQMEGQVQAMTKEKEEKEMNDFFEEAVKLGKVEAGEVDSLQKLYVLDKAEVKAVISARREKDNKQMTTSIVNTNKLSKEDYDIMEKEGYNPSDPNDVRKYINAIGGNV